MCQLVKITLEDSGNYTIPLQQVDKAVMEQIIEYAEMHDFKPPKLVTPLKSPKLSENISAKDFQFVSKYGYHEDNTKVIELLQACHYLSIPSLEAVCIACISTEFYVGPEVEAIDKLKTKHNVTEDLTLERVEELKNEFPFIVKSGERQKE